MSNDLMKHVMKCVRAQVSSHVRFFATPWTVAYQAPSSMEFSRQEYWSGVLPGASTGVPTHDKDMWENPDRQGESGLEDHPLAPDLPERLPQNQNLSVLLFYNFHQLL